ncbi:hypothetical protein RFI_28207 [Reticulomyxa filosa]|uniref:Uncharacterized protein n=1 Tax=Reticulomyxa filosa TaxID=46433 RepID=X6M826_RETFI|nr:hypothetical protein RFI_28207 [Reticulomyxa filosa]|eukprot:ETO09180.1 hypothetical protein RFI_28207 [Reticulomyxa filosa]
MFIWNVQKKKKTQTKKKKNESIEKLGKDYGVNLTSHLSASHTYFDQKSSIDPQVVEDRIGKTQWKMHNNMTRDDTLMSLPTPHQRQSFIPQLFRNQYCWDFNGGCLALQADSKASDLNSVTLRNDYTYAVLIFGKAWTCRRRRRRRRRHWQKARSQ